MDFIDLKTQQSRLQPGLDEAIARVLQHGQYIMGPEVADLESKLCIFSGVKHSISCANGTNALALVLLAKKIGPGDAVFIPSFTFAATAEVVVLLGATPVFVDVEADTFNMSPESLLQSIEAIKKTSLRIAAIITVDLFGQTADYANIKAIATEYSAFLIADAAQSFGAYYQNQRVGTLADCSTTSFFPAKPLGCYGDGGAIFTNDAELNEVIRSLRVHGQGSNRYENIRIGLNGRLDTLQAAILLQKLCIFEDEIARRQIVASRYEAGLSSYVTTPTVSHGNVSVWAQYTIVIEQRDNLAVQLKLLGIPTMIYYPNPMHVQAPYRHFPQAPLGLPTTERLAKHVLSLPMHPYLEEEAQQLIISTIKQVLKEQPAILVA